MDFQPTPQEHATEFETFIAALRSKGTRRNYREGISWVTAKEPDSFFDLARKDRRRAEAYLIGFISTKRDEISTVTGRKLSTARLHNPVMAVKSFLDFWEVPLNWKRITTALPLARKVALDRGPTVEEVSDTERQLFTTRPRDVTA